MARHRRLISRGVSRIVPFLVAGTLFFAIDWAVHATQFFATKDTLSFGGTLLQNGKPMMGQQQLAFAFHKSGGGVFCTGNAAATADPASGAFNAQIDVSSCPGSALFDGSEVAVDVSVGNTVVAMGQPVGAVPYAKYADRVGIKDCPNGYTRDPNAMGMVLCKKPLANGAFDEMVRVMSGGRAFWIDRYEASVWQNADGSGMQYGLMEKDLMGVPAYYALSKTGVTPAGWMYVDWAYQACRASGKQMPTYPEWLAAGQGSPATTGAGVNGQCNSVVPGKPSLVVRVTGQGTSCASSFGAQDMAGNVSEIVASTNPANFFAFGLSNSGQITATIWYAGAVAYRSTDSISPASGGPAGDEIGFRCELLQ